MTRIVSVVLASLLGASIALAVDSVNVEQSATEQFQQGTFDDAVVNNLGELKLARRLDVLLKEDKDVAFVNALAADDKGNVYAATAPNGKLFRISAGGDVELWYSAKEKTLQSLAIGPKGEVYVGTGGGEGRIYRIAAKDKAELVLEKEGLAYIWAMVVLPDGRIVAGTGPKAELIVVTPDGKANAGEVLFAPEKEKQKNILAVAADRAGKTVYFGTDVDGLVFKFDLTLRKPFLLYDAEQSEISALVVAPDNVVYAATSDPSAAGGEGGGSPGGMPVRIGIFGDDDDEMMGQTPDRADDEDDSEADDEDVPAEKPASKPGLNKVIKIGLPAPAAPQAEGVVEPLLESKPAAGRVPPATQPARAARPTTRPEPTVRQPRNGPTGPGVRIIRGGPGGRMGPGGPGQQEGGNVVYKIDPAGFVTDVLHQPALLLAMLLDGDRLIVATGDGGESGAKVLSVKPGSDEVATLAKPKDVKQVLALAPGREGAILFGSANGAIIGKINQGYAAKGTFTSAAIDAKAISRWGVISQKSDTSAGGTVRIQTRSGNLEEPVDSLWSAWSEPAAASEPIAINSPAARFIQYRVVLSSDKATVTPVVDSVSLSYISDNQPPRLTAARAITPGAAGGEDGEGPADGPRPGMARVVRRPMPMPSRSGGPGGPGGDDESGPTGMIVINWEANDANNDTLETMLSFRKIGSQVWIPLFEKPLRGEQTYQWQTRGLPDGQYQVRVVVSDLPSNPASIARQDSRITDVFTIDNTAPVINNLRVVESKDGKATLAADLNDALSRLTGAQIKVDSAAIDGQVLLPVDAIWDQRSESLRFTVDLSAKPAGGHMVILTVTDLAGNTASAAIEVARE